MLKTSQFLFVTVTERCSLLMIVIKMPCQVLFYNVQKIEMRLEIIWGRIEKQMLLAHPEIVRFLERYTETVQLLVRVFKGKL